MDRESKRAEKERIQNTINILRLLYQKVQNSKRADRFIVSNDNKWGVVDSSGAVIIPYEYTRITTSNDKLFRVYRKPSCAVIGGTETNFWEVKDQAIFDYDGNMIVDFEPFSATRTVGNHGILLGYDDIYAGFHDAVYYVGYNGDVIKIEGSVLSVIVSEYIPDLLIVSPRLCRMDNYERYLKEDSFRDAKGIRLDKGYDTLELQECYDEIFELDKNTLIANGVSYQNNGYIKYALRNLENEHRHTDNEYKVLMGRINNTVVVLRDNYSPIAPYKKELAAKVVH